jgi:hypothetical protein
MVEGYEFSMDQALDKIGRLIRDPGVQIDTTGFIFALLVSALVGMIVSALYQMFYEDRATGSQINRCFPLMAPSITALFVAIQFSLPLSLGLLGALSIVRFRTPVKEPEEIGFLMLLIAASVVTATFQFLLLGALLAVGVAVLAAQRYLPGLAESHRKDGLVLLTLAGQPTEDARQQLLALLQKRLTRGSLQSVAYASDLTTIQYSFNGMPQDALNGLHDALQRITPVERLNVFFNRQGTLV